MNDFEFSIIIITLNEEISLPKLLDDLRSQSTKNFEIVLVDGKSEDRTVEIAKDFKKTFANIQIVVSDKRGFCYQRNLGAKYAKSDYLIFMDADNRLPKTFIEQISNNLTDTKYDLFTCCPEISSKDFKGKFGEFYMSYGLRLINMLGYPWLVGSMVGIKKHIFQEIEGFDENLRYAEDTDLAKKVKNHGYTYKIFSKPTYKYDFRRLKRDGILKMAFTYLKIRSGQIFKRRLDFDKEYPMGGVKRDSAN